MSAAGFEFWQALFLVIHVFGFLGACLLYPKAPCWMQKCTVVGVAIAMLVMVIAHAVALAGGWWSWWVAVLGLSFEHIAILLWLFRLYWQGKTAWTPSQPFPSL